MNLLVANRKKREIRVTRPLLRNARAIATDNRHIGPVRTGTILAWICLAAVATPTVSEAQNASIPDEYLRAAIEDALGKRDGEAITEAEMETLTVLRVQYVGVKDLTGLEHATGLTEL